MSQLAELRRRLSGLQHRRRRVRLGTGYSGFVLAAILVLAAAFLLDWLFELDRLQRAISLALGGALLVWAFRRYTLPWLRQREGTLGMALLVEQHESIDSDLIAALQFEADEAPAWGSRQLEQAVIDRVASAGKQIDVMRGLDRRGLRRRFRVLLFATVICATVGIGAPQHVAAFFNRLFLGSVHYPSRTMIESITVNGRTIDPRAPGRTPIRVACGQGIQFEVHCGGLLPAEAEVRMESVRERLSGPPLTLTAAADHPGVYSGQLPRLVEDAEYHVVAGDAWTDPGRLTVGQLPALEIRLEVEPPAYTTKEPGPQWMPTGLRQVVVMEGSRVRIHLRPDKPLKEAVATIVGQRYPLVRREGAAAGKEAPPPEWVLDPADETPLRPVREPVGYAIQITDADGQQLERPLDGMIRVRADAPPRVAAAVITRFVLPTAVPMIYLRAVDDFGLASLALACEVVRSDGRTEENELPIYALAKGQPPEKNIEKNYPFDLAPLKLVKGDTVKVTVRATDFRGPQEGKSTSSDPLALQVTDEQGVLAAMMEADKQSAAEIKDMIQRQLGIGESP